MQVETQHYDFYNDAKNCKSGIDSNLEENIIRILRKEGYISCDITKKLLPADGGNYLASLCEIDVKGKTKNGDKETAIFVKSMKSNCDDFETISVPGVYKTELFFYKELIKIFNELQDEANVPINERFNTVKCYDESYGLLVIMENVTRKGFKTWNRMDVISLSMAEESVKQLAIFHGLSFALKLRRTDYFNRTVKPMNPPHVFGKEWDEYTENFNKVALEQLDEDLREKVKNKLSYISKRMQEYYADESIKYCLCHGDYRPNNVMVKEEDGIVTEVIPVDYQLIYYGCPVLDLIYFMYMATDRRFRDTHMVYLKNLYYTSLDKFLRHFDISVESVFPRKLFDNLYQEKADFGLQISLLILQFAFVSENGDFPDVTKQSIADLEIKLDERYKARLTDAVEEMIDLGYV